jgi:hypothetical protein
MASARSRGWVRDMEGEEQGGQGERGVCEQKVRNDRASFGRDESGERPPKR